MHFFLVSRFPQSWDEHRTLITWWSALGSYTHHVAHNGTDLVLYHTHIPRLPASVLHRTCSLQAEPSCVQNLKPSNGLYRWVLARIQASENLSHTVSLRKLVMPSVSLRLHPLHTHTAEFVWVPSNYRGVTGSGCFWNGYPSRGHSRSCSRDIIRGPRFSEQRFPKIVHRKLYSP